MSDKISLETTFNTMQFIGKKPEIGKRIKVTQIHKQFFTLFPGYQVEGSIAFIHGCHYLVHDYLTILYPELLNKLGFGKTTLYGGTTEFGFKFFMPVFHPKDNKYHARFKILNQRVDLARHSWLMLEEEADRTLRYYKSFNELAPPMPELSLNEMLSSAFPSYRFINSHKHPFIQNRGVDTTKYDMDVEIH